MVEESRIPAREPGDVKPVAWSELPDRLRRALSSLPKDEWENVAVNICPSELLMDATALIAAFARVWEKSKAAEDYRVDRLPGDEREKFHAEFRQGLKAIAGTTIRLGVRAKLYGELQLAKELLTAYAQDMWQTTWTKAMARSAHAGTPPGQAPRPAPPRQAKPASQKPLPPKPAAAPPKLTAPPAALPAV